MDKTHFEIHNVSSHENEEVKIASTSKNQRETENEEELMLSDLHESNQFKNTTTIILEVEHEDLEKNEDCVSNFLGGGIQKARDVVLKCGEQHKKLLKTVLTVTLFIVYNIYLCGAIYHSWDYGINVNWCDGLGMLLTLTAIVYWSLFYYLILKKFWARQIKKYLTSAVVAQFRKATSNRLVSPIFFIVCLAGVLTFLIVDSRNDGDERRLMSMLGVIVILILLLLVSKHPGRVIWRQVMVGLALQFIVALIILRWEGGRNATTCISRKVTTFLNFALTGSKFIYSYLASGTANVTLTWSSATASTPIKSDALIVFPTVFVFQVLTIIYFVGFVVSLLYHLGAMIWVVGKLGWVLQVFIGTTAAESMNVAANIFLGMTEAPLLIQPYLSDMTCSELHAVMTGGFATIAGGALAAYITFGIEAGYLLSASVMAAPAALGLSKLVYPETKKSRTTAEHIQQITTKTTGNALDAAAQGAIQGIVVIGGIVAYLIAFLSFVTFLNAVIAWLGMLVGADYVSFEWILGKMFIPLAWVMGIEWDECEDVALLLGLKVVVNEFVAYERLATRMTHLSDRSKIISTYALCSFANFSAIGIQLGALGALAPNRRSDLVKTIGRAFITAVAVGFLNGCVAGMLISSTND